MSINPEVIGPHLEGEAEPKIALDSLGGKIVLERTDEALTPYGGLVAWSAFLKKLGLVGDLAQRFPGQRSSPNALSVMDVLQSFMLNCLCEGQRFAHVRSLQGDRGVAMVMGMKRVSGEDAFPRMIKKLEKGEVRKWIGWTERELYGALPREFVADWDSTVTTRYGHQEDTEVGYNPQKPGRRSHHPLLCVVAGSRLTLHMEWRKGNEVSAGGWQEAMEKLWAHPTIRERLKLNRGDKSFGQEKIMLWHEQEKIRPKYLFSLRLSPNVKRALVKVPWAYWEGKPTHGMEVIAESELQLEGWSCQRRVVFARTMKPRGERSPQAEFWGIPEEEVHAYVTNLTRDEASPEQVVLMHRKRGDAENVFDELKNQWGFRGFCSTRSIVTETSARLLLLTYNLWSLFVVLLTGEKHREAITSRRDFLLMAAQVIQSGRQKKVKIAVPKKWWKSLRSAYTRLSQWLSQTAPQLDLQAQMSRYWSPHPLLSPEKWFLQLYPPPA